MAYSIINAILTEDETDFSAAEAHGIATGMLCAGLTADSADWLAEVIQHAPSINTEQQQWLVRLYEQTRELLSSDGFEFDLFLPDDNTSLLERIVALKSWCMGFLFGISSITKLEYSAQAKEIVKDITEFTKLDNETTENEEEDEIALMELTEYLRTAILLLRADLSQNMDSNNQYETE